MHIKLKGLQNNIGFAYSNARKGEPVRVLVRAALTSADPAFHRYMEQIAGMFLSPAGLLPDQIHQFLAVIHADGTADLFVNDFAVNVEMKAKRDVKEGQLVRQKDIADIRRLRFPDISIKGSDRVVYTFKVNWRFGLYFDFTPAAAEGKQLVPPETKLDLGRLETDLGDLYRQLAFYNVYELLRTGAHFAEMQENGWFPFVELLPADFDELSRAYSDKFSLEGRVQAVVDRFNQARIQEITTRWWSNPRFAAKQTLIEAGVEAYLRGMPADFITSIKTLSSEIEGLLRDIYRTDTGATSMKTPRFVAHIAQKATQQSGSDLSLLMAGPFLEYLRDQTFANFNTATGDVPLSRHSVAHGEAAADVYTQARALQTILVLDQIYLSDNDLPAPGSDSSVTTESDQTATPDRAGDSRITL